MTVLDLEYKSTQMKFLTLELNNITTTTSNLNLQKKLVKAIDLDGTGFLYLI